MRPLTSVQRRSLGLASRKGGAPTGTVKGTIRLQVANVLLRSEWVTITNGTVLITRAGRAKLNEPVPDVPIYLAAGGGTKYKTDPKTHRQVEATDGDDLSDHGYTTLRHLSADELEPMNVELLHPDWKLRAEAHRKLSRADLDAARLSGLTHPEERVAELRRVAAERGQDVASELKRVELTRKAHDRAVRSLERKVRTDEEAA